jgi:hypothetical protein
MTTDEALKLALEFIEANHFGGPDAFELITAIKQALAAPTVQEQRPYAYANPDDISADTAFRWCEINEYTMPLYTTPPAAPVLEGRDWSLLDATQESLREHMAEIKRLKEAQPSVPDAIIEAGESPDYRDGWNDCRAEMLKGMKP